MSIDPDPGREPAPGDNDRLRSELLKLASALESAQRTVDDPAMRRVVRELVPLNESLAMTELLVRQVLLRLAHGRIRPDEDRS